MKQATALLALLALPCASFADGFDYTFVEGSLVNTELDGPIDVNGDGFGVNGSFGVNENMHVIAGYSDQDYDFGIDGNTFNVGVGFNTGINSNLDFVADVSYVDAEIATPFGSADEDGYGLGAGIRARPGQNVELDAGLTYVDLDDSDTVLSVGGRYYFSDSIAVGGSLADNDAGLSWTIGVRAQFGSR
jgi:opacity protein-like surface antigen